MSPALSACLSPPSIDVLAGVFDLIAEDAKRALRARVSQLNTAPTVLGLRVRKPSKEYKIATRDWIVEFLADAEVPAGDVEIHSELNEASQPGYCGTKTNLMNREPSVSGQRTTSQRGEARNSGDPVLAEIRYEDDSGSQLFLVTQNEIRIGRGGDGQTMDLALYSNDEVSREHLVLRREAATGVFLVVDKSTNGTWLDGKRLGHRGDPAEQGRNRCRRSPDALLRGAPMNWLYVAHIPYVLLFVVFTAGLVLGNWRGRRLP